METLWLLLFFLYSVLLLLLFLFLLVLSHGCRWNDVRWCYVVSWFSVFLVCVCISLRYTPKTATTNDDGANTDICTTTTTTYNHVNYYCTTQTLTHSTTHCKIVTVMCVPFVIFRSSKSLYMCACACMCLCQKWIESKKTKMKNINQNNNNCWQLHQPPPQATTTILTVCLLAHHGR